MAFSHTLAAIRRGSTDPKHVAELLRDWERLDKVVRQDLPYALREPLPATERQDAERFRALMRCGRISMQGSSGVDPNTLERTGNNVHFGAEFWPEPLPDDYRRNHAESTAKYDRMTKWGRACLMHLADAIMEHEASVRETVG